MVRGPPPPFVKNRGTVRTATESAANESSLRISNCAFFVVSHVNRFPPLWFSLIDGLMGVGSYLYFHNGHTLHKCEENIFKRFCFSFKMSCSLSLWPSFFFFLFPVFTPRKWARKHRIVAPGIIAVSLFSLKVMQDLLNRGSFIQKHRACYFLYFLQHRIIPPLPHRWTESSAWTEKTTYPSNLLLASNSS